MFQIKNQELNNLDKEIADFYKLITRYSTDFSNLHGGKIYKSKLSKISESTEKIKPESEFDELISKNIQSNLKLNDLVIDFFTNPNFHLSVEEFINEIAGKDAWEYLEQKIKFLPYELEWEYKEKTQEMNFNSINLFTKEAKEAAEKWVPKIKEDILNYGKSDGYLPNDFDMTILLLPPEGGDTSSWNPKTKIFNLSSQGFRFLHKNGEVTAIPAWAYQDAFHEILGHASHQIYSNDLPLSVRLSNEIMCITPTKSVTEGIAEDRGRRSLKFLIERLDELELTKEDIEILEMDIKLSHYATCQIIYGSLIKDKELREKGFDGFEHILKLTNNPLLAKVFKYDFKLGIIDAWRHFGHALGGLHYKKMEDIAKKEFGEDFIQKEKRKFNQATSMGVWSWEVYPEAVCYFLNNLP